MFKLFKWLIWGTLTFLGYVGALGHSPWVMLVIGYLSCLVWIGLEAVSVTTPAPLDAAPAPEGPDPANDISDTP